MTPTPTHTAALEYALKQGWYVFPVEPPRFGDDESGKRPLTPNGKDDATRDPAVINAWWARWPNANVGIAVEPSRLVVLDVDTGRKKDGTSKRGRESLAELEATTPLPDTLTALTGGGGLHAYFSADDEPALQKLGFKDGLDLIGKGYVIAAPSLHHTGKAYAWNVIKPIERIPPALRLVASVAKTAKATTSTAEREAIPQGGRNIALFRLGAALRDQGIGREALARALDAENRERCNPPVDDVELKTIIDSVLQRVTPRRDVATAAIVEQEVQQIFAPAPRAVWVRDIAAKEEPPTRFFSTGFERLDTLLGGGFASRHQCGVLGPPSSGKSAFIDTILDTLQTQIPVLHVSAELPREELFVRKACAKLGIPWRDGLKGLVPRAAMQQAVDGLRIQVIGCEDLDRNDPFGSIVQAAMDLTQKLGVPVAVAIDYVQLLARGAAEQMRHKVGELSMRTRILAQTLDAPVIAVYSTGRAFYGGKQLEIMRGANDPTAYLAAAKESGDVEFDCATMLYLDVDKLADGQPKPARVVVPRCRVGDVGFVGARAKLDTGVWWDDPSALGEMTNTDRNMRQEQERNDNDVMRLCDLIRRMPKRPWREIRAAMGSAPRAEAARAAGIERGLISLNRETFFDAMQRKQTREILSVIDVVPPTNVVTEGAS